MSFIANADEQVLLWISGLAGRFSLLDSIIRVVVNDYFIPVILSLLLLALWFIGKNMKVRERYQRTVLQAAASMGITNGFVKIINLFYFRTRPFEAIPELLPQIDRLFYRPTDSSFPSNAAAVVFAAATAVWFGHRKMGITLYLLAFLMCFARIYAGAHYPLDIIGGMVLGAITAYFTIKIVFPICEPMTAFVIWVTRKLCIA
jgi:undecaprenyl-diphosphatase